MTLSDTALAFVLVCGAGSSTCLGAAVVYHPTYIKLANKITLGAALGISSGVMLYVSFIEIFSKSLGAFEDDGFSESDAYLYTTLCFFFGFVLMNVLNKIVHTLDPDDMGHSEIDFDILADVAMNANNVDATKCRNQAVNDDTTHSANYNDLDQLNSLELAVDKAVLSDDCSSQPKSSETGSVTLENKKKVIDGKLHRMGLVTALAIGLHNFPEGLATFVATLADPAVGLALAVAIAIHNIPEGLCVAIPIYFATGDRHRAFLWACVSGLSEVIAAGLGWIVLSTMFGDLVYAILFGAVSGMMVNICIYQLLPTAHKYDPQDKYVSHFTLLGMVVMAASLVIFLY